MTTGETDLQLLLKTLKPRNNEGDFVFCVLNKQTHVDLKDVVMIFKEGEGSTVIIKKDLADALNLEYSFVASWITLSVHSSLSAVGLTAAFSNALSKAGISCNVVAAYYHDHIFVDKKDLEKAMNVLSILSQ